MTTYKNPWHKPNNRDLYGPEYYTTDAKPQEYKGYFIYERIPCNVWDVVKDGVCVTQMAGPSGALRAIDKLIEDSK